MKTLVLSISCLLYFAYAVCAQDFSVSASQSTVHMVCGDSTAIAVVVHPANGFNAPVFLTTNIRMFRGVAMVSRSSIDYPYADTAWLILQPFLADTGTQRIDILGKNNTTTSSATVVVTTDPNGTIRKIGPLGKPYRSLFLHNAQGQRYFVNDSSLVAFNDNAITDKVIDPSTESLHAFSGNDLISYDHYAKKYFRFDGSYWREFSTPAYIGDSLRCMQSDNHGLLYLGSNLGCGSYDGNQWNQLPDGLLGSQTALDSVGTIWSYANNTLRHFVAGQTENIPLPEAVRQGGPWHLRTITADQFGRIWCTFDIQPGSKSDTILVAYLHNDRWTVYDPMLYGTYYNPVSISISSDSSAWLSFIFGPCTCPQTISLYQIKSDSIMNHSLYARALVDDQSFADILVQDPTHIFLTGYTHDYNLYEYTPLVFQGRPMKSSEFVVDVQDDVTPSNSQFYPQPCNDVLYIHSAESAQVSSLRVYTMQGVLVSEHTTSPSTTATLSTRDLPNGVYLLQQGTMRELFVVRHE